MIRCPVGYDVLAFVEWPSGEDTYLADIHASTSRTLVQSYTRGRGFSDDGTHCEEDIAAVIVTAAARSLSNPEQTTEEEIGSLRTRPAIFNGWTLPELAVLHSYRRRAA